jgi:hypothetical protein
VSRQSASAVECARGGCRVFEVAPRGKTPLIPGWQHRATNDPAAVEAMWANQPEANIGICCGDGLLVIDADTQAGAELVCDLGVTATTTGRAAEPDRGFGARLSLIWRKGTAQSRANRPMRGGGSS